MPEDQDQPEPFGLHAVTQHLPAIVERISSAGLHAVPLPLGRYSQPEAVLISLAQFYALRDYFDDLVSAPEIRHRLESAPADDEVEAFAPEDLDALITDEGAQDG